MGEAPMKRIYCAGPLFNPKEREDMETIAQCLEDAGYEVFLPHRDGIELAKINSALLEKGYSPEKANLLLARAIFLIDTFQIMKADGLVLNLNGRVPDEGAMVESGIAWALRKPVVIYKNDSRSLLQGLDNPLVAGLSEFRTVSLIGDIPHEFKRLFDNGYNDMVSKNLSPYNDVLEKGRKIYEAYKNWHGPEQDQDLFLDILSA
jgi:nucleoside 2-deoxyribosyltransferase